MRGTNVVQNMQHAVTVDNFAPPTS